MADQGLVLRILIVFVMIVTVLLFIRHYQRRRRTDTFAQRGDNPFASDYSNDVYAPPGSSSASGLPQIVSPYDQGVPFYAEKQVPIAPPEPVVMNTTANGGLPDGMSGSDPTSNEVFRKVDFQVSPPPPNAGCFPKDRLTAQDLLPKDAANSTWSKVMPSGQGDVSNQNFLTAGYQMGISTSVIRNPNYGLRSEPVNPSAVVSPWLNSTIEPDVMRRPLELASAPSC